MRNVIKPVPGKLYRSIVHAVNQASPTFSRSSMSRALMSRACFHIMSPLVNGRSRRWVGSAEVLSDVYPQRGNTANRQRRPRQDDIAQHLMLRVGMAH